MNNNLIAFFISVLAGLLSGWLVWVFRHVIENRKHLAIAMKAMCLWKTEIRVSISYLFRIKISGTYLLVKGNRFDQYQPVGGVFKMLPSFKDIKRNYEVMDDDHIRIDETNKDDLRIRVKGKNLLKLLSWFKLRKNREVGVHREFYEEMIKTRILTIDSLAKFTPEYCQTITTNIEFSKEFQCEEVKIYEIYELDLSESEEQLVKDFVMKFPEQAILATQDEINKTRITVPNQPDLKKIGEHTKHIL